MTTKLSLLILTCILMSVVTSSPVFFQPRDILSVVKRETPKSDDKISSGDQDTSATGYGHGGGGYAPTGYVNYGAKTGGYGAFSWYSDHPVGGYGSYGYH